MRKKDATLREALLAYARETADTKGTDALNIRSLAAQAGVSVGTVYNYFRSKDDILLALTEAYWESTLADMRSAVHGESFLAQIKETYAFLRSRIDSSAGALMSSLRNVEQTGRERMDSMQQTLRTTILHQMAQDGGIRQDIWRDAFSREQYADFIIMNLMLSLRMHAPDIRFFLEIIKKTLYSEKE